VGFLVSFFALYGSHANLLTSHIAGASIKSGVIYPSSGLVWLEQSEFAHVAAPLLALAALLTLKLIVVCIIVGVAVKVTAKVDHEAEYLWNERRLTFMHQTTQRQRDQQRL
jgi:hypothetical protein